MVAGVGRKFLKDLRKAHDGFWPEQQFRPGARHAEIVSPRDGADQFTESPTNPVFLKSKVSALNAGDETYIAPGILWGWRTLSTKAFFGDGAPPARE
jgi:hypothetical protein